MARTEEITLYSFNELEDSAKETARQQCRENIDHYYSESVYEDAEKVAAILGIEFDSKKIPLMNGTYRSAPKIWFSGFYSQGDGACFEGSYSYAKGSTKRIREYAPNDNDLHSIADNLANVQRRNFYQLRATCEHSGRYYHSGCMSVAVEHCEDQWRDIGDAEDEITDELRSFADWIYSQLEKEYEYLTSDEQVEDSIIANEYEFHENGTIA